MNIYVDFDDVLCETARGLTVLCARLFNRPAVPYEDIRAFDLRESFHLDETEYETLMDAAHAPAEILGYEPTPNAAETLRSWQVAGLATSIVTGRPPSTHDASVEWLRKHNFPELPLLFLDKYNRHAAAREVRRRTADARPPFISWEELEKLHFDIAIEDAPAAVALLESRPACRVIVFARPWNTRCAPVHERLHSWPQINERVT